MKLTTLISTLCAAALVAADQRTAQIYVQPISRDSDLPQPLAEVSYDPLAPSTSSIISYEAPDIPEGVSLVRIGVYDPKTSKWTAGTTATSVENFSKGYSPNLILSVNEKGDVLSAACKGVRIDAGETRDFGPKALVMVEAKGKQPELNKPVVLSPEGKKVEPEAEKTLLQKYVDVTIWVMGEIANRLQVLVGDCYCGGDDNIWRRRSKIDVDTEICDLFPCSILEPSTCKRSEDSSVHYLSKPCRSDMRTRMLPSGLT